MLISAVHTEMHRMLTDIYLSLIHILYTGAVRIVSDDEDLNEGEEAYEAAHAAEKTNNMPAKEMGFVSVCLLYTSHPFFHSPQTRHWSGL